MNSGPARWALAHLNAWTWLVAEYRIWLIVIASVIGIAAPLLSASRKRGPRPAPSVDGGRERVPADGQITARWRT